MSTDDPGDTLPADQARAQAARPPRSVSPGSTAMSDLLWMLLAFAVGALLAVLVGVVMVEVLT